MRALLREDMTLAARQQHQQARIKALDRLTESYPAHGGHADIGENNVEATRASLRRPRAACPLGVVIGV